MSTICAEGGNEARESIAVALLRWNNIASRAGNEQPIRQSACDLLVHQCGFGAASLGAARAGEEHPAQAVRSFPLRCDDIELGTLRVASRDALAFAPTTLEALAAWSEGLGRILLAARKRGGRPSVHDPLHLAIDTMPALAWIASPDGALERWNTRHLEFTGFAHEQSVGDGWQDAIHPEDRDHIVAVWKTGVTTGTSCACEARLRRADGTYRWHHFCARPIRDESGNVVKWIGANHDVEDFKQTEDALRRSEAFLAKAQRLSLTGSFAWNTVSGDIIWSDETYRIFGVDRGRTIPSLDLVLQRAHPDDLGAVREQIERVRRERGDFEAQFRLLMPDGAVKHIHVVAQAVSGPRASEYVGAVMDVTAAREMTQALDFRDQVMGIVGHDLRNPLGAVLGIAQLAQRDGSLSDTAQRHVTQIERAASRMEELIEALLDFTQTRFAGRLPISPTQTDLGEVCARVVSELAAGHPQRTIDLETRGDARGKWDPGRMAQLVSNLVGNALTHGDPRAPVRLAIEGAEALRLLVHNRGPAIDARHIPALFEPFRRGETAGVSARRGLGLGLHIAKQIAVAHGGSISVHSSPDEGTTFCVELPRVAARPDEPSR
jgi:PAS domain S-box-containing protein